MQTVEPSTTPIFQDVWTIRRKLSTSGYWPIAVYSHNANVTSPGKQPVGERWQERPQGAEPNAVTTAPNANALNTGILCDGLRAIDIDIDYTETANKVASLVTSMLGGAPVRYRNDSARRLILYRATTGEPRKRIITGALGNVEILGRGQQFVAFGTHPEGSQYLWNPGDFAAYHYSQLVAVTEEQIDELLKAVALSIEASPHQMSVVERTSTDKFSKLHIQKPATEHERAYALKALADNAAELAAKQIGSGRNGALNGIAYRMGRMIGAGWIEQATVEKSLAEASRRNGYEAKDGTEAMSKTLQSGLKSGVENPHSPLDEVPIHECVLEFSRQVQSFSKTQYVAPNSIPSYTPSTDQSLIIHRVADVKAQPVHWLWYPRIALGKVTLISGDPGLGKSQLTAFLAAKVSTGGMWPNNDGQAPIGSVLMLSCEDDVADTIRPRLEAVGADLNRVHVIEAVRVGEGRSRGFSITADLMPLEDALKSNPDIRLVTVDPITAYLGGIDTHRTSDVRAALGPLQTMAAKYGVAVVAVSHLNKASGGGKSVNAVTGSGAFVAAARASFLVAKDEADEERRLLIESKNNLGRAPGLSFRINQRTLASGIVAPFVEFEPGTVSTTADQALGASILSGEGGASREAEEFLRSELASGDVPTETLKRLAADADISWRTLRRAGDKIGAQRVKAGFQGGWVWRLPEASKVAKKCKEGHSENLDIFGSLRPPSTRKDDTD